MPDLNFKIAGVRAALHGLTPLLNFDLEITNQPPGETIHSVILQSQIQVQSPQRSYSASEKKRLVELFGQPSQWGHTLRNRHWVTASTNVGGFAGSSAVQLSVPCSYDLNIAVTKYFYALDDGDVPLLFLFSGTIFYSAADGRLQVQQISWNKEAAFRMPVRVWRELMEEHFPNCAWLYLRRDVFDRLYAFKRSSGFATWEQTLERLLPAEEREEVPA